MLLSVVVGVVVLAMTTFAPGAAAAATPPGLSITLSDAKAQTQSGATLTYTAAVTNAGADPFTGRLDITVPSYATYVGTADGNHNGADVSWSIAVGAGKSVSRKVTVKLGTIPRNEVRFTTIATLYPAGNATQILVRTADPDAIRGVVDPAHSVGLRPATKDKPRVAIVLLIIVLGAIVVVAVALLVWIRKRRSARGSNE